MTTELTLLVWSAGLTLAQAMLAAVGGNLQRGVPTMAGNREECQNDADQAQRTLTCSDRTLKVLQRIQNLPPDTQHHGQAAANETCHGYRQGIAQTQ